MMAMAAMATTLTLTSCGSDNDGDNIPGDSSILAADGKTLKGNLIGKQTLEAGDYVLGGTVIIENGGELTIPAGTTIKAAKGFSSYILVAQGGKLYANGTSAAPVTFTSGETTPKSGDWGGIILNGKAPISGANESGNTANAEVNNAYKYGGDNASDNSGALTYVNIFYAGARNTADIEHNGLTLNGVGNGTKVENIYILESADDAIEFFGGTVNVTNLLAVNPDDDMFDFTQGYTGTLKNCYGIWEEGYTSTEEAPRGIEADGNLEPLEEQRGETPPSAQRIAHPGENAARFPSFHRGHFRSAQRHGQEPQDAADDQEEHQLESRRRKRRVLVYRHHHGSRDGEESEERQRAFERRPAHRAHRTHVSRRRLRYATSIAHAASTPFLT